MLMVVILVEGDYHLLPIRKIGFKIKISEKQIDYKF